MADAASWLLLAALADQVRGITRAAGYMTDLGIGPVLLDDDTLDDDTAGTVIEAGDITVTSSSPQQVSFDMDVVIEFSVPRAAPAADTAPTAPFDHAGNAKQQVHRSLLDLVRALQIKPRELPKFVRTFEQTGARLVSGTDESGATFLVAQVTARAGLTQIHHPDA